MAFPLQRSVLGVVHRCRRAARASRIPSIMLRGSALNSVCMWLNSIRLANPQIKLWQIESITRGFHRQMNPRQIEAGPQILARGRCSRLEPLTPGSYEVAATQEFRALATELGQLDGFRGRRPDWVCTKVFLSCYLTRR